jgi:hypothetical protein
MKGGLLLAVAALALAHVSTAGASPTSAAAKAVHFRTIAYGTSSYTGPLPDSLTYDVTSRGAAQMIATGTGSPAKRGEAESTPTLDPAPSRARELH